MAVLGLEDILRASEGRLFAGSCRQCVSKVEFVELRKILSIGRNYTNGANFMMGMEI
jgi:hypothetical protein